MKHSHSSQKGVMTNVELGFMTIYGVQQMYTTNYKRGKNAKIKTGGGGKRAMRGSQRGKIGK
jgi:hypothetical protein